MKKLIAMILAALMVFAMAGCGSSEPTNVDLGQPTTAANAGTTAAPTTAGETTEATVPASLPEVPDLDPTEPAPTEPEPTQSQETETLPLGTVTGTTYTNEYIGLTFEGPVDFEYASYEDILVANGLTLSSTMVEMETKLGEGDFLFLAAEGENTFAAVSGSLLTPSELSNLNIQEELSAITTEEVLAIFNIDGLADVEFDYDKYTFGEGDVDALTVSAKIGELDFGAIVAYYVHDNLLITAISYTTELSELEALIESTLVY